MSSSQMVSTDRWNRSVVLTTRRRQTPPPKQRRGGAALVAWLPVLWVPSTAWPSLMKVLLRREDGWSFKRLVFLAGHPAECHGGFVSGSAHSHLFRSCWWVRDHCYSFLTRSKPAWNDCQSKQTCLVTYFFPISFISTRVIKMWDLRKNYTAHRHDPVPLQTYPYPGSCMRMRLGSLSTIPDNMFFFAEICKRPENADSCFGMSCRLFRTCSGLHEIQCHL